MELYLQHIKISNCQYNFNSPSNLKNIIKKYNLDLKEFDIFYNPDNDYNRIIDEQLFDLFCIENTEEITVFYEDILSLSDDDKVPLVIYGQDIGELYFDFDLEEIKDLTCYYQVDCYNELAEKLYHEGVFEAVPNWMENNMEDVYELLSHILEDEWSEIEVDDLTYFYKVN